MLQNAQWVWQFPKINNGNKSYGYDWSSKESTLELETQFFVGSLGASANLTKINNYLNENIQAKKDSSNIFKNYNAASKPQGERD